MDKNIETILYIYIEQEKNNRIVDESTISSIELKLNAEKLVNEGYLSEMYSCDGKKLLTKSYMTNNKGIQLVCEYFKELTGELGLYNERIYSGLLHHPV